MPSMCNTNILCILLIRRVVFLVSYHVVLDVAMTRESLFYYFVILLFCYFILGSDDCFRIELPESQLLDVRIVST